VAIYIPIRKVAEDEEFVEYWFEAAKTEGRIRFRKWSEEFTILEPEPVGELVAMASRVIYKVQKHMKNGELPDETCWAA